MLDAEVNLENVVLFVSAKVYTFLKQSNLISRQTNVQLANKIIDREIEVLDGHPIIKVPQTRFYSAIDMNDGSSVGETGGGYVKATTGLDINFMAVDTSAVLGIKKTALPRLFEPTVYQGANAWKFDYRLYHDMFVPANKVDGIYLHTVAEAS